MPRHVFTAEERAEGTRNGAVAGGKARAATMPREVRQQGGLTRAAQPSFLDACSKGFWATAERHGIDFALRKAAAKRKARPTAGEAFVARALDGFGLLADYDYQREVAVWIMDGRPRYIDFVVIRPATGERLCIEVDGPFHDPVADAVRDEALLGLGFPTLRLPTELIRRRPEEALRQLAEALLAADGEAEVAA